MVQHALKNHLFYQPSLPLFRSTEVEIEIARFGVEYSWSESAPMHLYVTENRGSGPKNREHS